MLPPASGDAFGTVAGLLGAGWSMCVRVLHPAGRRRPDDVMSPLTWSQVAELTGRSFDRATGSWFDASGARPHSGRLPDGVDAEPENGPFATTTHDAVITDLAAASHLSADDVVDFARWEGYGDWRPPEPASPQDVGIRRCYTLRLPLRRYLAGSWRADHVSGGSWLLATDVDAMSTYAGLAAGISPEWAADLETVTVPTGAPVS